MGACRMFLLPKDDRFLEIISELGRNVSFTIPKYWDAFRRERKYRPRFLSKLIDRLISWTTARHYLKGISLKLLITLNNMSSIFYDI